MSAVRTLRLQCFVAAAPPKTGWVLMGVMYHQSHGSGVWGVASSWRPEFCLPPNPPSKSYPQLLLQEAAPIQLSSSQGSVLSFFPALCSGCGWVLSCLGLASTPLSRCSVCGTPSVRDLSLDDRLQGSAA